ncbi:50S ribosomal protein L22 [Patescibacteria group bacterium]|nr:50S ribosomal protein L22 [Patescibacteria group bacterium]
MSSTAKLRYLRIAPRKVRLISDLIRGKSIREAQALLNFTTKKAALPVLKLLKQAIANIKQSSQIEEGNLYISKITVDEGPKLKRWMPRARGQVSEIQKKTSHIILVLDEIATKQKIVKKLKKAKEEKIQKKEVGLQKGEERRAEKPKLRPEIRFLKPKVEKGTKRFFKRKAF